MQTKQQLVSLKCRIKHYELLLRTGNGVVMNSLCIAHPTSGCYCIQCCEIWNKWVKRCFITRNSLSASDVNVIAVVRCPTENLPNLIWTVRASIRIWKLIERSLACMRLALSNISIEIEFHESIEARSLKASESSRLHLNSGSIVLIIVLSIVLSNSRTFWATASSVVLCWFVVIRIFAQNEIESIWLTFLFFFSFYFAGEFVDLRLNMSEQLMKWLT